ncbi:MAG TPA: dethiobiotin synthase, partial [Polyangiaceae bacterium]|nr:dethiobiotin synthase [Polyangiaceae bacterium]
MRIVVLGCGTGVGKTRLSAALLRALASRGMPALGLKPIESGVARAAHSEGPPPGSDADTLAQAGSLQTVAPHPLYALATPVSPHLAARMAGVQLELPRIRDWVERAERAVTPHVMPHMALWSVIETAGGV